MDPLASLVPTIREFKSRPRINRRVRVSFPTANQSGDIRGVLHKQDNRPNYGDIHEFDWTNDPSQSSDRAGPVILSLWSSNPV